MPDQDFDAAQCRTPLPFPPSSPATNRPTNQLTNRPTDQQIEQITHTHVTAANYSSMVQTPHSAKMMPMTPSSMNSMSGVPMTAHSMMGGGMTPHSATGSAGASVPLSLPLSFFLLPLFFSLLCFIDSNQAGEPMQQTVLIQKITTEATQTQRTGVMLQAVVAAKPTSDDINATQLAGPQGSLCEHEGGAPLLLQRPGLPPQGRRRTPHKPLRDEGTQPEEKHKREGGVLGLHTI